MKGVKVWSNKFWADLGFQITSKTPRELFVKAGLFLTRLQAKKIKPESFQTFTLQAKTLPDLLWQFLTQLIFLRDSKNFFPQKIDVALHQKGEDKFALEAKLWGGPAKKEADLCGPEIKGISYHHLKVRKTKKGWQANVVVDI